MLEEFEKSFCYINKVYTRVFVELCRDVDLRTFRNGCVYNFFGTNTVITVFFRSVQGNTARRLSDDRTCEVGAITEGNIPDADRLLYLLPEYVKNLRKKN